MIQALTSAPSHKNSKLCHKISVPHLLLGQNHNDKKVPVKPCLSNLVKNILRENKQNI